MFRHTALLIAGILVLGSASTLAAQQATPPKKAEPPHKAMAAMPAEMHGTPTHMWTTEQVKDAQLALSHLKLYDGKVTGTMNSDTEEALRQFQRSHNMAVTGRLSDSVLVRLRRESSMKSPTR